MPKKKRDKVFIWPTWVTKLVAGENQCEWASWFRAHYKYDKKPSNFNLALWTANHQALLRERRRGLIKLGYKVFIEDQNSFKFDVLIPAKENVERTLAGDLKNKTDAISFTISGKADIVAIGEEEDAIITGKMNPVAVIEDCKTGSCKTSDQIQVMFYMMLLPKAIERYKGIKFSGIVVYKIGVPNVDIPATAGEDESLKRYLWGTMKRIAGDEAGCPKIPSKKECGWCDIPYGECNERIS